MYSLRLGLGIVSTIVSSLGLFALVESVEAQRCCRTGCEPSERDSRGCCPASYCEPSGGAHGGGHGHGGHGGHGGDPVTVPEAECSPGQVRNVDTAGHCCWPGQAWSPTQRRCVGVPECPSERYPERDDCLCPSGMDDRSPDARGHCCWPGQVWMQSRSECTGTPQCPSQFAARGMTCIPAPASCPVGQVQNAATQYQCCWPGQRWDPSRGECAGVPQCESNGWTRVGDRCIAPAQACRAGMVADASTSHQCCWPGQSWNAEQGSCSGVPTCTDGWARAGDHCVPPMEYCPNGQVSNAATANQCCWPGQRWDGSRGQCAGMPACPEGWARGGMSCFAPPETCMEGLVRSDVTQGQCCWPGQRWDMESGRCAGQPRCDEEGWTPVGDHCVSPTSNCIDGMISDESTSHQCCWPGQFWDASGAGQCAGVPTCLPGWARAGDHCRAPPAVCATGKLTTAESVGQCCWPGQRWNADEGRCAGVPTQCPAETLVSGEDCTREAYDAHVAAVRGYAAYQREWAFWVDYWPVGYGPGDAFSFGGGLSGLALFPIARDDHGTSVFAPYIGGSATSIVSLGSSTFGGTAPFTVDLRADAGVALGPLVLAASTRLTLLQGEYIQYVAGAVGPTVGLVILGGEGDDFAVSAQLSWLPDLYDGNEGWGNVDAGVRFTFGERVGLSGRFRYDQQIAGARDVVTFNAGVSLMFGEGVEDDVRTRLHSWRWNSSDHPARNLAVILGLDGIGYMSVGDSFAFGGTAAVVGRIPISRDSDGNTVLAPYFGGTAGLFASPDTGNVSFDLRGDAGVTIGPVIVAASVRLAVLDDSRTTVGGSGGPTLGVYLLGNRDDDFAMLTTISWLPDVYDDRGVGNIDAALNLAFLEGLVGMSLRFRYDEQVDGRSDSVFFGLGLGVMFADL